MSTLRRMKPLVESSCKSLGLRSLHTVPSLAAKPRRSPKITQKLARVPGGTPVPGTVRVRKAIDPEESLPPIALLRSGSKSGLLDISPEKALAVLRQYQELAQKSSPGWEGKLCDGKLGASIVFGLISLHKTRS